jgi:hypothetical protein
LVGQAFLPFPIKSDNSFHEEDKQEFPWATIADFLLTLAVGV